MHDSISLMLHSTGSLAAYQVFTQMISVPEVWAILLKEQQKLEIWFSLTSRMKVNAVHSNRLWPFIPFLLKKKKKDLKNFRCFNFFEQLLISTPKLFFYFHVLWGCSFIVKILFLILVPLIYWQGFSSLICQKFENYHK